MKIENAMKLHKMLLLSALLCLSSGVFASFLGLTLELDSLHLNRCQWVVMVCLPVGLFIWHVAHREYKRYIVTSN